MSQRLKQLLLLCSVLALLVAPATSQEPAGSVSSPSIQSFSPQQGAQGSTVNLSIQGYNFGKNPIVQFSPSTGITVLSTNLVPPDQPYMIQAVISISPSAPLGPRQLQVMVDTQIATAQSPFTVVPGAPPEKHPPAISSFTPAEGAQGSSLTLILNGANIPSDAVLQFSPSSGIHVTGSAVPSPNQLQAQITIDEIAVPGPRQLGITSKSGNASAPTPFTVVPFTPVILRIIPNQIPAGSKGVELRLEGRHFSPGAQVSISGGDVFTPGAVRFINATEVHITADVLPTALLGGRDVTITNPSRSASTGKGILNITAAGVTPPPPPAHVGPVPILKLPPLDLQFQEGVIQLLVPDWGVHNDGPDHAKTDHGVPLLDDDLKFEWKEVNPGMAEYFEVRFLAKDGKTVIKKARIDPVKGSIFGHTVSLLPTHFRPDAALLDDLLTHLQPVSKLHIHFLTPHDTQISDGDLLWQVAGYKTFNQDGVKKTEAASAQPAAAQGDSKNSEQKDVEVEVSDSWPLRRPETPNGFGACPVDGTNSTLSVQNQDKGTGKDTTAHAVDHVGDNFVLSGKIDLSRSPYGSHPKDIFYPGQEGVLIKSVEEHDFDNLFVDWGDGTTEALKVAAQSGSAGWRRSEMVALPDPRNCIPSTSYDSHCQRHHYDNPGNYNIKLFQLAEGDAQHTNPATLTAAYEGKGISSYLNLVALSTTANLATAKTLVSTPQTSAPKSVTNQSKSALTMLEAGSSPKDIANRAYVLFCSQVTVEEPKDEQAFGPLHLDSIVVTGFPGHDAAPSGGGTISPVASKAVLSAGGGKGSASAAARAPARSLATTGSAVTGPAICSTCDKSLQAHARLKYVGEGDIVVQWRVNGQAIGSPDSKHVPSSPQRKFNAGTKTWVDDDSKWGEFDLDSPVLNTDVVGAYDVTVDARVQPKLSLPNLSHAVAGALGLTGSTSTTTTADKAYLGLATGGVSAASAGQAAATPIKVGVLSPYKTAGAFPPVIYAAVGGPGLAPGTSGNLVTVALPPGNLQMVIDGPPLYVQSSRKPYKVVANDPSQPCKFIFKTADGDYTIYLKQGALKKNADGSYSGDGNISVNLNNSPTGHAEHTVPISFTNWQVQADGITITDGTPLTATPDKDIAATGVGVVGKLSKLEGIAGQKMEATLDLKLADNRLRIPGSEQTVSWNGLKSKLKSSGDWYKTDGISLPDTLIGWSGFHIQSPQIAIDLSDTDGSGPGGACATSGLTWRGVSLGAAKVKPNTLDLVTLEVPVSDWVVKDHLCGHLTRSNVLLNSPVGKGTVSITNLDAYAHPDGTFSAAYDMDVRVPWLATDLKGTATLLEAKATEGELDFKNLKAASVDRDMGLIHMHAENFRFGTDKGGWRVIADTTWNFQAEGKPFTPGPIAVNDMHFGMGGYAYFDNDGKPATDVPLGGSVMLGKTRADLVSLHLNAPGSGDLHLNLAFATKLHLSDAIPASDVQVNYDIRGDHYSASGPYTSPFTAQVSFPAGQPTVSATISPNYSPGGGSGELYPPSFEDEDLLAGLDAYKSPLLAGDPLLRRRYIISPLTGALVRPMMMGGSSDNRYNGSVDLAEFGGPPVKGEFVLGYQGGSDYWLTRVTIGLGEEGIPLAPPIP
ncbi:MAG TPA: IPT/TIG domain-containing protein, partial [Terriglobales bacterium]|nr:IPT/TIG domain-containing protein [Terriglobales bacterium]